MTTGDGEILPEDLIFEILLLLLVTSLIRFKCVSKRWKEIISNPEFSYLHYSKISPNRYLVDIMATVSQECYTLTDSPWIPKQYAIRWSYNKCISHPTSAASTVMKTKVLNTIEKYCWVLVGDCIANSASAEINLPDGIHRWKVVPLPFAPRDDSIYHIGYGFGASTKNEPANPPSDFKFVKFSYNTAVDKKILKVYSSRNKSWHSVEASVGPGCVPIYRGIKGIELNQVIHRTGVYGHGLC